MNRLTADQWRLARDLFEAAVDQPPADVHGWLAAQTPDEAVRREVASLLTAHSNAGGFLTQPAGTLSELLVDDDNAGDAGDGNDGEHAADSPATILAGGQQLGHYRIDREVGRGGMGRIYRAVDTQLGRTVAIKVLSPALASDASQRERLRREARAAAALTHPGICTVHALEEIDAQLFIVSEFIDGETLRDVIERHRPLPAAEVIEMAMQLAAALASAHTAGVTHRDLKPENVMRTADGRLKVLDFGLARQQQESAASVPPLVTQPGVLVGTLAYMTPEQLNGRPADARTDVFAAAVIVYELATGQHPFAAETPLARAGRVLEATPEALNRRRPDLPAAFAAAVERALAKDPEARFQSAGAFLAALADGRLAGDRASSASHDAAARTTQEDRSHPAALAMPGDAGWWRVHQVVVIALYIAAAVLGWFIKEWLAHGAATWGFIVLSGLGTISGILRGHLVFTERTHGSGLARELRRLTPATLAGDLLMAAVLAADGLGLALARREVAAVLTLALAIAIAIARLVLEPSTTRRAFRLTTDD